MDMREYQILLKEIKKLKRENPGQYPTIIAFVERFSGYVTEEHQRMQHEQSEDHGNIG